MKVFASSVLAGLAAIHFAVPAMADPPLQQMVSVSFEDGLAAAIKHPDPVYTIPARKMKIEGRVEITAMVDTEGKVVGSIIVLGNPILTHMAKDAVAKWEFKTFVDGDGKPARAMVHLRFELKPPAGK